MLSEPAGPVRQLSPPWADLADGHVMPPDARPRSIELLARGLAGRSGRVLACRNVRHGHVFLPGGHVEPGESASGALAREFAEESGEAVLVGPLLLVAESRFVQQGRPRHEVNLVFHVEHSAGAWPAAVASREPHIEFLWFTPAELVDQLLPAAVGRWIEVALRAGGPVGGSGVGWLSDGV